MDKARVYERPYGGISVIYPGEPDRLPDENDDVFFERVCQRAMKLAGMESQPFFDTTEDQLPQDKTKTDKWRMKADKKGIVVDESVRTAHDVVAELNAESKKPDEEMNVKKVLRLQGELREGKLI